MASGNLVQGKNEFLYFFIERKLECIGTGNAVLTSFTVSKKPIADSDLSGSVTTADVEVFLGDALRTNLVAATVSTVDEETGAITLSAAPATGKKVYATYKYVYGHATYVQEYSLSSELDSKDITPLSEDSSEVMETAWKYEGSVKFWDAHDIELELMNGIAQDDDTVGGTYAKQAPIPVPLHNAVLKKVRASVNSYRALGDVKVTSFEESDSGGEVGEKDFKLSVKDVIRGYAPTTHSGI